MEKLKQYKWIIIIMLVILGGLFYWYEYRPTQIKKECAEWALNKASDNKKTTYDQDGYDDYYKRCLREKGL